MSQTIILSLKKWNKIIIKTHEKVEVIFKIYFLSSSVVSTNNIKKSFYSLSTNDEKTMTNRKLIKVIHKIDINKILKVNEIINRALKQFVAIVMK